MRGPEREGALRRIAIPVVAAFVAALTLVQTAAAEEGATGSWAASSVTCVMESSAVNGPSATFTVGPPGCTVPLGPVSFSTYDLPGGFAQPFSEQDLHSHSPDNGQFYGEGTYQLAAPIDGLCNWQSDLYRGTGQDYAPHIHFIEGPGVGWDKVEGETCTATVPRELPPVEPAGQPLPAPQEVPSGVPQPASAGHGVVTGPTDADGPAPVTSTSGPHGPIVSPATVQTAEIDNGSFAWLMVGAALGVVALGVIALGWAASRRAPGNGG